MVFEGIDGAGKTTQAAKAAERLTAEGFAVVASKEPTNGPWGTMIRESAQTGRLDAEAELEAFVKDRQEHVANLIEPALAEGKIVLLDRYYFSSAAYQGIRPPHTVEEILEINERFAPKPDLLVLLDVDPRLGLKRVQGRGDVANLFEKVDDLDRSRVVFRGFKSLPFAIQLNAADDVDELSERILRQIQLAGVEKIAKDQRIPPENKVTLVSDYLRPPEMAV